MTLPGLKIGQKHAELCIIQGGMSVRISLAPLVSAVAQQGGVGTIGGMGIPPDELRANIRQVRKATTGVFGVNLMYIGTLFDRLLNVCIEEKVDFVAIGAGFARGPFRKLGEHNIPAFCIISSTKAADIAARTPGITGIVVESGQAGGHLGPKDPEISTWDLFPEAFNALKQRQFSGPIIAAGGILTRDDINKALAMGASGVQIGTRFAVSQESSASPQMKQRWVEAVGSQVQWWSPTGYASRAIVPHTTENLPKADGVKIKCSGCLKYCTHRQDPNNSHCILTALINSQQGDVEHGLVFSGPRINEIHDVPSVDEIFKRLVR